MNDRQSVIADQIYLCGTADHLEQQRRAQARRTLHLLVDEAQKPQVEAEEVQQRHQLLLARLPQLLQPLRGLRHVHSEEVARCLAQLEGGFVN